MVFDHPISDLNMATSFPDFVRALSSKLRKGADEHGDNSFSRTGSDLTKELSAEAIDLAGWGFILWHRIQELEQRLKDAEARSAGIL